MSEHPSSGNRIHPTAIIGPEVELGTGNVIGPYSVLLGPLRVGDGNWIGPHVSIGAPAEIRGGAHPAAWDEPGEGPGITIGDRNTFRDFVCVHQPSAGSPAGTVVGSDCYIMNKVYIPHDAQLGDAVTIASSVAMGGHVKLGDGVNLGLNSTVHQRRIVGPGAMVGMGSVITRDVPPYAKSFGNPARVRGVNTVGMSRAGIPAEAIEALVDLYAKDDFSPEHIPAGLERAFTWWQSATAH
ncbi:UDP-N-acetylglucosamine acyltransferase [Catellatospora bangladeshensis]|uniref:Acyl-[acyl-carrier-protein]--UDP-N-acetylglucosam ine O-acyltransferase n=1 Tax=Catellatospora bangladeshensis TaxID=310355 RepID=A0A8J3NLA0_9ACTN|nr:UDP-N-acetylglucosamine acyltransferase [Catellatospora bangladeshensis]GIF85285.1 acyl-[acyl-carrier-protein]--UDP-N-acetylglucosam ine O-acyltransferase [Catellatospora bangladeshensis]